LNNANGFKNIVLPEVKTPGMVASPSAQEADDEEDDEDDGEE